MKSIVTSKVWKPSPLPLSFHHALESGRWQEALQLYNTHPFHAPPGDTFELLKVLLHETNVNVDHVKKRFDSRQQVRAVRKTEHPQVEWGRFWTSLNYGDAETITASFNGAKISGPSQQTAVAEACAVLLTSVGKSWKRDLVENVPFSTVTKNNLLSAALQRNRWDVALDILNHAKVSKNDMNNVWPMMRGLDWRVGLLFASQCPKSAVSFGVVLPQLLEAGCDLGTLAEQLERAKVLNDADVVAPLLDHAMQIGDYDFTLRMMDHLEDIGMISTAAHRVFKHLCEAEGAKTVVMRLVASGIKLHQISVTDLEEAQRA